MLVAWTAGHDRHAVIRVGLLQQSGTVSCHMHMCVHMHTCMHACMHASLSQGRYSVTGFDGGCRIDHQMGCLMTHCLASGKPFRHVCGTHLWHRRPVTCSMHAQWTSFNANEERHALAPLQLEAVAQPTCHHTQQRSLLSLTQEVSRQRAPSRQARLFQQGCGLQASRAAAHAMSSLEQALSLKLWLMWCVM